jgi:hypothetical protein
LPPFPTQIGPYQVSFLSTVSLAVESLAVASLANANFLAGIDFAGSSGSAPDFLPRVAPASLGLEAGVPTSDFFLMVIFVYPLRARSSPVLTSCNGASPWFRAATVVFVAALGLYAACVAAGAGVPGCNNFARRRLAGIDLLG